MANRIASTFLIVIRFAILSPLPCVAAEPEIKPEITKKHLDHVKQYCKTKSITHLVEHIVAHRQQMDSTKLEPVLAMATDVFHQASKIEPDKGWSKSRYLPRPSLNDPAISAKDFQWRRSLCLEGLELTGKQLPAELKGMNDQIGIISHTVAIDYSLRNVILLTNASKSRFDILNDSLVISSGEIELTGWGDHSTIISQQSIHLQTSSRSYISSGDAITFNGVPLAKMSAFDRAKGLFLENQPPPFGLHFYSTREDGLEVVIEKGIAKVKSIAKDSLYAPLGLREGDVLEKVNSGKVDSLTELNRLMCRAMVTNRQVMVVIQRGNETLIGKMTFPEAKK